MRTSNHRVEPIERFPAKPRPDGRFQKRINGKLHYFGRDGDRRAAVLEYEKVKRDLYAGRRAPAFVRQGGDLSLGDLVARYITHLTSENAAGRLSGNHLKRATQALARLELFIGSDVLVSDLSPEDFSAYARKLAQKLGHYAFNHERAIVGAMFNLAGGPNGMGWIPHPVRIGPGFKKYPKATMRQQRKSKLVDPAVYLALLAFAGPKMEAMLLLAGNCGYGHTDFAALTWKMIDLDGAIIPDFPRPKNGIDRTNTLWPETVEALRELRAANPDAEQPFITRHGNRWTAGAGGHEMVKLVDRLNVSRKELKLPEIGDVVMGDLRHTFATFASEGCDRDAWSRLMGHAMPGLRDTYIETLFTPRLRAVTSHVRDRLLLAKNL